ncbi:DUF4148 domain-containing protein [Paucibacter sp. R3-3]|uniref:DUF4148 domain-containing protein n=1 Tax=Roseateles agri TaxID=3098619 RepID=A0ABU5DB94_9BURK|nr:DUF4148 domain-containing protein [Paucibacter sp. R3-3]MDY0743543.1 DUF4148 domain-containing protein [Paucibacter sp. R3-3]
MNRKLSLLIAAAALAASAAHAQDTRPAVEPTRAEVLADLVVYRESGLQQLDNSDLVSNFTPEYRAAQKRYQDLRRSPRYAELVRSFETHDGHAAEGTRTAGVTTKP